MSPEIRELKHEHIIGSVAERSNAMVLCTSHFDGLGSNPNPSNVCFLRILFTFL